MSTNDNASNKTVLRPDKAYYNEAFEGSEEVVTETNQADMRDIAMELVKPYGPILIEYALTEFERQGRGYVHFMINHYSEALASEPGIPYDGFMAYGVLPPPPEIYDYPQRFVGCVRGYDPEKDIVFLVEFLDGMVAGVVGFQQLTSGH